MLDLLRHWVAFKLDRRGVTALEYAIIAGLIGSAIVVAVSTLGGNMSTEFTNIAKDV